MILFFLSVFNVGICMSQDTIILRNRDKIPARIIMVKPGDITYKKAAIPNGPDYVVSRRHVAYIIYQNGISESFNPIDEPRPEKKREYPAVEIERSGPFIFSVTPSDLIFTLLSGNVEYLFSDDVFSIRTPFSFGMVNMGVNKSGYTPPWDEQFPISSGNGYYDPNKIFSVGLDLSYYMSKKQMFRYFIGPSLEYGQYYYQARIPKQSIQNPPYYYEYEYKKDREIYSSMMFKNGIIVQPHRHITVMMTASLGFESLRYKNYISKNEWYYDNNINPAVQGALHVGYRFGRVK
jgi:hypothetical protein